MPAGCNRWAPTPCTRLDDAAGCIGRIEIEIVGDPQAKELANIAELRILLVAIESMLVIGSGSSSQTSGLRTMVDQAE